MAIALGGVRRFHLGMVMSRYGPDGFLGDALGPDGSLANQCMGHGLMLAKSHVQIVWTLDGEIP